ncbi:bifunctional hydroxymethylpyrimidine kinase/phosphomethylpyrimidine kinase [Vagococcus penaei]|uniref:Pyridoxamine kinase/Phosphomethylpyrimidine kinase domain-containing protein n=1 Tax=Vagococcus penaei TaxID=633807 RepID=A0A1Q2D4B4_9ENTE|nr:bifunctional hydroxymethylpyrimidine kinase/phosphomethylpyrimidine kinase [Vagococcus penaei]AQP53244.1 hypothetical protein BW732_02670 [Vagococcus penaei]
MIEKALTISYSNASSQSGIQADLTIFQAFHVFGFTTITNLLLPNKSSNYPIQKYPIQPTIINQQLTTVLLGGPINAVKIDILDVSDLHILTLISDYHEQFKHIVIDLFPLIHQNETDALTINPFNMLRPLFLSTTCIILTPDIVSLMINQMNVSLEKHLLVAIHKLIEAGLTNIIILDQSLSELNFQLHRSNSQILSRSLKKSDVPSEMSIRACFSAALTANLAKELPIEKAFKQAIDYIENDL